MAAEVCPTSRSLLLRELRAVDVTAACQRPDNVARQRRRLSVSVCTRWLSHGVIPYSTIVGAAFAVFGTVLTLTFIVFAS